MASRSASSVTLSFHTDEYENDAQIIPDNDEPNIVCLPEEYRRAVTEDSLPPSMRAASNPDPNILKTLLSHGYFLSEQQRCDEETRDPKILDFSSEFSHGAIRSKGRSIVGITTPLMEAINAHLPANVKILLEAGANPNGVPHCIMEDYAALFLRFRPSIKGLFDGSPDVARRSVFLENMNVPQISNLTCEEVEDREGCSMAPFWCEEGFTQACFWTHGETMPSLVLAAKSGETEIVDMLLHAGADATFWKRPQFYVPEPASESSLSVSSPLHAAIEAEGFEPNTMPLANPTRCVTPLMATIVHCSSFNKEAFDILCRAPSINFELRTPVYGVHILHFAVARLDLELLKHVAGKTPLENAGETALGHTLLHVACMCANVAQIQRHSDIIRKSIHETRDLRPFDDINPECFSHGCGYFSAQTEMVKYLWNNGVRDFSKLDVHGNTALHYLAGCRGLNEELFAWLLSEGGSETLCVWQEAQNIHGATPKILEMASKGVRLVNGDAAKIDFDRHWSKARAHRKAETWREVLEMPDPEMLAPR
ncbi:hypothetical protein LSUB1_G006651 [Lachnellula subtilissima]|uniref:Ankyrin n=1 Tax=Lachnellula subtilissima TaxID=602034 RepID=A0A8H8U7S1_9HELO|nr:hypothetical protein LSUB1_G006651 [Lachnellula subtilissima]